MNCFNKKNQHIGRLQEVDRTSVDWDCDAVTRWCPKCGAVVVDKEYDCRRMGTYAKMRFPEITKEALKQKKRPQQRVHRSLWEEEWICTEKN